MSFRKEQYKDLDKWRTSVTNYNREYYRKTANHERREWTKEEDDLVMKHDCLDRDLSDKIDRSMKAIVIRRHKLKKDGAYNENS